MHDEEGVPPEPARAQGGPSPTLLLVIGLALVVGGWKLSTWIPRPADKDGLFGDLQQYAGSEGEWDRKAPSGPPLQLPGRLAFVAGAGLFAFALWKMSRAPSPPPEAG
mgnify:CR=1 FL=1